MSNLSEKVKELSEIERSVLLNIDANLVNLDKVALASGVGIDSVRRASAWLKEKGLAIIEESEGENFVLTPAGEVALKKGMPETILLNTLRELGGKSTFSELEQKSQLSKQEFMAALGINKRKAFVVISAGSIEETGVAGDSQDFQNKIFCKIFLVQRK